MRSFDFSLSNCNKIFYVNIENDDKYKYPVLRY